MNEIKPKLPEWVDPGEVKHSWPPPNPDGIITREPPRAVLDRIVLEGTAEFNRGFRSRL